MQSLAPVTYQPIGFFSCQQRYPAEVPRQPSFANNEGYIELDSSLNLPQALKDLDQFSHIWVIFSFHHNAHWKPLTSPPGDAKKRGVFATRSPYRPNSIGLSCLELTFTKKNKLFVKNHDLLDRTPILDIKPYVTHCDQILSANKGWLETESPLKITYNKLVHQKITWLQEHIFINFKDIITSQLKFKPLSKTNRLTPLAGNQFYLHHRTWKILFLLQDNEVLIEDIESNYTIKHLSALNDPYQDKQSHKEFAMKFNDLRHT